MRSTIRAALAGCLMLGLAVPAAAQSAGTLKAFSRADFERALREAGATVAPAEEGNERIDFTFDDGVIADALLLACKDEAKQKGCLGSSLLATFSPADGATPEQIQEAINTFNYRENFGRAYLEPDGTIAVRMYIIADGGITRENYATQIGLWFASVGNFFGYLYGEAEAEVPAAEAAT